MLENMINCYLIRKRVYNMIPDSKRKKRDEGVIRTNDLCLRIRSAIRFELVESHDLCLFVSKFYFFQNRVSYNSYSKHLGG